MHIYLLLFIAQLARGTQTKNQSVKLPVLFNNTYNISHTNPYNHNQYKNSEIIKKTIISDYKVIMKENLPYFVLMATYIAFWAIILFDAQKISHGPFIVSF
jgi:hypothetical protein